MKKNDKSEKPKRNMRGKDFEEALIAQSEIYERKGTMTLTKCYVPMMVVGPGKVIILKKRNQFVDFAGSWKRHGGKAVFIEAKATKDDRLEINGAQGHGVDERQVASLRRWRRAGAIACALWRSCHGTLLLKVQALDRFIESGARNLKWEEVVEMGDDMVMLVEGDDFEPAMERLYYPMG